MIAVSVCIGYGDFLKITYSYNRPCVDKYVIVPSESDTETCDFLRTLSDVDIVYYTGSLYKRFNKGEMINAGLKYAYCFDDPWTLILDADCALSGPVNTVLLNSSTLYGAVRHMLSTYGEYLHCLRNGRIDFEKLTSYPVHPCTFDPCYGYFQLFRERKFYPNCYDSANNSDAYFRWSFMREHVLDAPLVAHLGYPQRNWNGRVTEDWTEASKTIKPENLCPNCGSSYTLIARDNTRLCRNCQHRWKGDTADNG